MILIDNPWFYAAALPAVFINVISKGGFGSGLGIVSVPFHRLCYGFLLVAGVKLLYDSDIRLI